jgi:hypothetical protein
MNTARKLAPPSPLHTHLALKPRTSAVPFRMLAKEARTKQGECRALVAKGHICNPRYR